MAKRYRLFFGDKLDTTPMSEFVLKFEDVDGYDQVREVSAACPTTITENAQGVWGHAPEGTLAVRIFNTDRKLLGVVRPA